METGGSNLGSTSAAGGLANEAAIAGITASVTLGAIFLLCILSCCIGRYLIRTGRCPKRLRLLLAGYSLEAKFVNHHEMSYREKRRQVGSDTDEVLESCTASGARTSAEATAPPRATRTSWWATPSRQSPVEHDDSVDQLEEASLFPPGFAGGAREEPTKLRVGGQLRFVMGSRSKIKRCKCKGNASEDTEATYENGMSQDDDEVELANAEETPAHESQRVWLEREESLGMRVVLGRPGTVPSGLPPGALPFDGNPFGSGA